MSGETTFWSLLHIYFQINVRDSSKRTENIKRQQPKRMCWTYDECGANGARNIQGKYKEKKIREKTLENNKLINLI